MPSNDNPFSRYAYSQYDELTAPTNSAAFQAQVAPRPTFTGGDLHAYINNIPVRNLESVTWTVTVEVAGNYVMGSRDPVVYTTGKRVIVGTLVFNEYNKHAFLEEVFQLSTRNIRTYRDLWLDPSLNNPSTNAGLALVNNNVNIATPTISGANPGLTSGFVTTASNSTAAAMNLIGLSAAQFNAQLIAQLEETSAIVASTKITYSDQIPPFDLTLIGAKETGEVSSCAIFGIQITQETNSRSSSDLNNGVGLSFVALGITPWRAVSTTAGTATVTGVNS